MSKAELCGLWLKLKKRENANASAHMERMANDPRFREEMQRKEEIELEMHAIKQAALLCVARLTMDQAIQIASSQTAGKVLECSLNAEKWEAQGKLAKDGYVFYYVIIGDENNLGATHVLMNVDGSIITTEKDVPANAALNGIKPSHLNCPLECADSSALWPKW
ncbi:MAG: PepSY domain-containing protein [Pyrinomonadaceae bacterium]